MRLRLAYYPDPILRKKADRVNIIDDSLRQLVNDMVETMHANRGIGLAAPQIHYSLSIFVSCVPIQGAGGKWHQGQNRVFINPIILSSSDDIQLSEEGCLSIPHIAVNVKRPVSIQIQAIDLLGKTFEETLTGLHAANFLHELDHLNGVLTVDYLTDNQRREIEPQLEDLKRKFHNPHQK